MKLIDKLRTPWTKLVMPRYVSPSFESRWRQHGARVTRMIQDAKPPIPVILADNVAEYYYTGSDQEFWDLRRDFPNLAPPYTQFWIEHKMQREIRSKVTGYTDMRHIVGPDAKLGVLFMCADRDNVKGEQIPEGTHWIYVIEMYFDWGLGSMPPEGPVGTFVICLDEKGIIVDRPSMQSFCDINDKERTEQLQHSLQWCHPALLSICFLHCKNVRVVDEEPSEKLAKRTEERHGFRPSPHKRLIIEPLKEILKKEGRSGEVGLAKAMHICRGHFAEYGDTYGKGKLFGRYEGKFWIPSTVRGTKSGGKKEDIEQKEIEIKL